MVEEKGITDQHLASELGEDMWCKLLQRAGTESLVLFFHVHVPKRGTITRVPRQRQTEGAVTSGCQGFREMGVGRNLAQEVGLALAGRGAPLPGAGGKQEGWCTCVEL